MISYMKKIRISFMLATFCIALGTAFAFTPKHVKAPTLLRVCNTDEFVPIESGLPCVADDPGKCEYIDENTPDPESEDGCVNPPANKR